MSDICGDNRFQLIDACKKDFLENTNISDEEKKVLDRMCFRMWQLGLLKKYEEINEEELDDLAYDICNNKIKGEQGFVNDDIYVLERGFKAGYREALKL